MKYFYVKKENENIVNKWEDTEKNRNRMTAWGLVEYIGEIEETEQGVLYVKGTIPQKDPETKKMEQIIALQKFLNDTDWYVARYAETGVEIPADIKAKRQVAREKIDELRAEIEDLAKQLRATEETSATGKENLQVEELINNTIKYPTQLRVGFIFGYFLSTIPGVPYTCSLLEPRLLLTTVPVFVIRSPVLDHTLFHHIGLFRGYISLGLQGLTGGQ